MGDVYKSEPPEGKMQRLGLAMAKPDDALVNSVERVEAVNFVREAVGGATLPLALICRRQSGETVEAFVKFTWQNCTVAGLAREIIAAQFAEKLGLPHGRPLLVDVPEDIVELLPGAARARASGSIKPAFGSKVLEDHATVPRSVTGLPPTLRARAIEIWAFDELLLNPDRTQAKPNCLTNGLDIAVIDHEKALDCIGVGGLVPAPWEERWQPHDNHIFYPLARSGGGNLATVRPAWSKITIADVDAALSSVPAEWGLNSTTRGETRAYLSDLIGNIDNALMNLEKVLS